MKSSDLKLKIDSSPAWIAAVLNDFDHFLKDHADAERKASGMAMSFVAKYPDRREIIPELIHTGIEELEHFRLVYKIMEERGLQLNHSIEKDIYIDKLLKTMHSGREERFRDRLVIASIVENRGFERFKMVSDHIEDKKLADFYRMIYLSEAKHGHVFVDMALNYFPAPEVFERWEVLASLEADILSDLAIRPTLH
ncbi:MAG: tRNA-(ms[2]io[6]A)-hydroxylase [Croceimicrobium sp.]